MSAGAPTVAVPPLAISPSAVPPLAIGTLEVGPPVVLAPMAGVTNRAFRRLCRGYGAGLYVSEMITARALVEGNAKTLDMVTFDDDEPYRSVQLYGVDPVVMHGAVRGLIDDIGVDHIDLNFGCPAAKVTRKGGGAALPVHRALLQAIISAAVGAAGPVPVTVKLRLGVDHSHLTFLESGRIAAEEGAASVALHARTAEQLYSGSADWTAIGELKAHVTGVPVLGNGDIWEASDALAMMAATGCDGVVVGRGCLGRPWLFRDLADAFAGRPLQEPPNLGEVSAVMVAHARLLCGLFGESHGIRQFRKHVSWYLTGFPVGGEHRRGMAQLDSVADLEAAVAGLDASQPFPIEAMRMARGHTNGPRPVALPPGWLQSVDDLTPPAGGDELVSGG
jgi:nifR3 family TIM-barrel protein